MLQVRFNLDDDEQIDWKTNKEGYFNEERIKIKNCDFLSDFLLEDHENTIFICNFFPIPKKYLNQPNVFHVSEFYFCLLDLIEAKHELLLIDNTKNYPAIKRTDPIVRYFDAKPGQVFKITRKKIIIFIIESSLFKFFVFLLFFVHLVVVLL